METGFAQNAMLIILQQIRDVTGVLQLIFKEVMHPEEHFLAIETVLQEGTRQEIVTMVVKQVIHLIILVIPHILIVTNIKIAKFYLGH